LKICYKNNKEKGAINIITNEGACDSSASLGGWVVCGAVSHCHLGSA